MKELPIEQRLEVLLRGWPAPLARVLSGHRCVANSGTKPGTGPTDAASPYWMRLPRWVHEAHAGRGAEASALLADLLWVQYALFLAVRLQDDVYDGQSEEPALIYAASLLLFEADRTLDDRFSGDRRYRELARTSLDVTTRAIVEVDALQRSPRGLGIDALGAYARVAELFKVGSAALSIHLGRKDDLPELGRYADALAVAGQILDDLDDLEEDLASGRLTFAAWTLLGETGTDERSWDQVRQRIGQALVVDDGVGTLLTEVRGRFDVADSAAVALGLEPARRYVEDLRRRVDRLEEDVHRRRVDAFFGAVSARPDES